MSRPVIKSANLTIAQAQRQIEELQAHINFLKTQNREAQIKQIILELGLSMQPFGTQSDVEITEDSQAGGVDGYLIKLPLPHANTMWTLAMYKWMEKFVTNKPKHIDAYPCHYRDLDNSRYLHIKVIFKQL